MQVLKVAGGLCWAALVFAGFWFAGRYEQTPGKAASAPGQVQSAGSGRPLVLAFIHPLCPCTSVTLANLQEIAATRADNADYRIYAARVPASEKPRSGPLPGMTWIEDDGREAAKYGAETSGQIIVYDARGKRCFSGGITVARGHYGTSPGGQALLDILDGRPPKISEAPVYGCALPTQEEQEIVR
ncbi:MAG TPA: hypothetical protein VEX38_03445 [Fimbriimonadaceae bacterium]|nr:hypothetical protein [Fimbriimonadaceae bacterium]